MPRDFLIRLLLMSAASNRPLLANVRTYGQLALPRPTVTFCLVS